MSTQRDPVADRQRHRRVARECGALIDLLDQELHPASATPGINATDREVGAWIARRDLIAGLQALRTEVDEGHHRVLGRR